MNIQPLNEKWLKILEWAENHHNFALLIVCTEFSTSCEIQYDIFVEKSIKNRFKQPCCFTMLGLIKEN